MIAAVLMNLRLRIWDSSIVLTSTSTTTAGSKSTAMSAVPEFVVQT
jgi:hypothetical protein